MGESRGGRSTLGAGSSYPHWTAQPTHGGRVPCDVHPHECKSRAEGFSDWVWFVIITSLLENAPLAQLDRASGYEPEGREFESLRARHFSTFPVINPSN